ncbi:cupin domain-containing protein [Chlorobium sp. N1]|nr:cupin domain-containing protein [Chlorobium sp. N1]
MQRSLLRLVLLCLFCAAPLSMAAAAEPGAAKGVAILPEEIVWVSNPKLHGLKTSVLRGDPSLPEPYVQRIRLAPGTRLEPHFHPNEGRVVTVLEGTLYFAFGERFDNAALRAMPAGSFFTEPVKVPHFAVAGSEEVVLELHAIGPDGTTYVDSDHH